MPSRLVLATLVLAGLSGLAGSVPMARAGSTYTLTDDEGVTHLTNAPTDPRFRKIASDSGTANGWLRLPEPTRVTRWAQDIAEIAERHGVDPRLVHAVISAESAFNPWAVSRKGAQGLMQLMPRTASALGVRDSFNPRDNIEGGVRHLRYLIDRYPGNVSLAIAAYNAGEGAVDAYGGIPPYPETQQYVQKVLSRGGSALTAAAATRVDSASVTPVSDPPPPPQVIYRSEDSDGTMVFSNVPPVGQVRRAQN